MTDIPVDLSPFRGMIDFAAGAYVALVSITASISEGEGSLPNWIELSDPAIGMFGLWQDWELPAGETDMTQVYGYHVMSGNNTESPFATLNLVNLARTLKDNPDPERTHLVIDHVFEPIADNDPGRTGYVRCEVYRGPPLVDIIEHLDGSDVFNALGDSFDTVRTAFQYRRDGVVGRIGAFEKEITVGTAEKRMRISIPLAGEDHTPAFELL